MVEEFMLLANISVAQKIYDEFPDCAMLRKHPAPPPSNYDILLKASKSKVSGGRRIMQKNRLVFKFYVMNGGCCPFIGSSIRYLKCELNHI